MNVVNQLVILSTINYKIKTTLHLKKTADYISVSTELIDCSLGVMRSAMAAGCTGTLTAAAFSGESE